MMKNMIIKDPAPPAKVANMRGNRESRFESLE
jgi:hypothetical protein